MACAESSIELSNDFQSLYESALGSDVIFTVGEKELRAHKCILSSRSPVFAKMFEIDMLEKNTNRVNIEDVDWHTFDCFLIFLYTGVVQDTKHETVKSLYCMAEQYQVKSLHTTCVRLLITQISFESACTLLALADMHGDDGLKFVVMTFIQDNFYGIVGTSGWFEWITPRPELHNEVISSIKPIDNANGTEAGGSGCQASKTNLIVSDLPRSWDTAMLQTVFSSAGKIESCKVIRDTAGQSFGYGFVNYFRAEDAEKAISTLSGLSLSNTYNSIKVAPANQYLR